MATSRSRVFFAIPCGGFYDLQAEAIRRVARAVGVEPVVAEDDVRTKELWRKITADIDRCDLFVADIGSDSKNIALELGYALAKSLQIASASSSRTRQVTRRICGVTSSRNTGA